MQTGLEEVRKHEEAQLTRFSQRNSSAREREREHECECGCPGGVADAGVTRRAATLHRLAEPNLHPNASQQLIPAIWEEEQKG